MKYQTWELDKIWISTNKKLGQFHAIVPTRVICAMINNKLTNPKHWTIVVVHFEVYHQTLCLTPKGEKNDYQLGVGFFLVTMHKAHQACTNSGI